MIFLERMVEMINFIVTYWREILFCVLAFVLVIYGCMTGKCIEWLKYAVAEAEKYLGSGTGQLKLRQVYDLFTDKYPVFSTIVPFALFKYWVDVALKWFNKQLESNKSVKEFVESDI